MTAYTPPLYHIHLHTYTRAAGYRCTLRYLPLPTHPLPFHPGRLPDYRAPLRATAD